MNDDINNDGLLNGNNVNEVEESKYVSSKMKKVQLIRDLDNLNEPDHGILFGLESLIKLLTELKDNGSISKRNDKEWTLFTQSISYSNKALSPFANKKDFNEHTIV